MSSVLVATPEDSEADALVEGFRALGHDASDLRLGRIDCLEIRGLDLVVAVGGHGKAQFAAQTQHMLDNAPALAALICAGACGALDDAVAAGDVIVGAATVEHDYRLRFVQRPLPEHPGDPGLIQALREAAAARSFEFETHIGRIASGDEDVIDWERAAEIRKASGALAVAWEGAGGARAASFSGVPFAELRVVTDGADAGAAAEFDERLAMVMPNAAELLDAWRRPLGASELRPVRLIRPAIVARYEVNT